MSNIAPEPILKAALTVLHVAAYTTRNWSLSDEVSRKQMNNLWEAIHDIPGLLMRWAPDTEEELLGYLEEYGRKWDAPDLLSIYELALKGGGETVVAEGSAHYDGDYRYRVRIVKTGIRRGSGDYEDPPDVRDDHYGEFYEVRYGEDLPNGGSIGSAFETLQEAKTHVEGSCPDVQWSWMEESP